ncbi:preprotein translocase subunit YajC [Acetobacter fallax]|uniref:Sec translocon accessory complex subunit YajC n=1 Tax=Acetobacter fallax TaxID=1737473 RepID=A0ABX0K4G6_9PROT|nr:preprotein translocase subunit YajC [Acetobacter fallax]NHO31237.1 preprotein translocase subunit YajC [Acetobacter fallax]NHO34794.1 preprotein translocase subunit YajC [Acetobacter fallax]
MPDFLISPAYAQTAGGIGGGLSSVVQFLPYVLVFGIFYFLMIRPQQQKQKQLRESLNKLRRGDRVLTAGGIIGVVRKSDPDSAEIELEIAPNVRVQVMRSTITSILNSTEKAANDTTPVTKA